VRDDENLLKEDIEGESETIHDMGKGLVAGTVATLIAAGLVLLKDAVGAVPMFNPIEMLTTFAGSTWSGTGWIIFFVGGIVALGLTFALLDARVEATTGAGETARGILFGVLVWLVFMLVFMPVYGAGAFGLTLGVGVPVITLGAAVIYGVVLGALYGAMHPETVAT
jgi:Family of unknown function (DUF6789)